MSRVIGWLQEQLLAGRPVVGSMIFAIANLPILTLLFGLQAYALHTPEVGALYRPAGLWFSQALIAGLMIWLSAITVYCWRARLDERVCSRLPLLTLTPTVVVLVILGLGHGLKDTPMSVPILVALFLGRALFGLKPLIPSMLLGVALVIGDEVLTLMGALPYAPMLSRPVFEGIAMAGWWNFWIRIQMYSSAAPFSGMVFFLFSTLARRRRELEELVRTDMLTGLANRRTFMDQLEIESHRHARNKRPFCLVMCDVDHFKKINDTWGHPAGDAVLIELGRILKRTTREQLDTAARIGGEEFAVLLPETDLQQAQAMAEAMSTGVRSRIFMFDGQEVTVTQSVGIAQTNKGDGEHALRVADDNLYVAKRGGRDRIVASVTESGEA
jgi:diguanylate cyclase (GGDEF)-like protein